MDKIKLSAAQTRDFGSVMTTLSEQSRQTIVIEGAPMVRELTPNVIAALPKEGNAQEVIRRVAWAFDYDVLPSPNVGKSGGVVLLRKRYTDPRDLPPVTFEECYKAIKDVQKILALFAPQPPITNNVHFVNETAASFSDEQKERLSKGGIRVSELSASQRKAVERMAAHLYITTPSQDIEQMVLSLEDDRKATLGEETPKFSQSKEVGLVQQTKYGKWFRSVYDISFGLMGVPPLSAPDVDFDRAPQASTLKEIVARLQKAFPQKSFAIDPILGDRKTMIFGAEFAPSADVFASLARVHGLRLVEKKDGAMLITPLPFKPARDVNELYDVVRKALPASLLRAFRDGEDAQYRTEMQTQRIKDDKISRQANADYKAGQITFTQAGDRIVAAGIMGRWENDRLKLEEWGQRPDRVGSEAVRRLRQYFNEAYRKSGKGTPFRTLNPPTRAAFGIILMAKLGRQLQAMPKDGGPMYIRYFDDAIVTLKTAPDGGDTLQTLMIQVLNRLGQGTEAGFAVPVH